jgi:hypothetical protein
VLTAAIAPLAVYTSLHLMEGSAFAQFLPPAVALAAYGVIAGGLISLGAAGAHIHVPVDRVEASYGRARSGLTGELADLAGKAVKIRRGIQQAIRDKGVPSKVAQEVSKRVDELAISIVSLGGRWREVEEEIETAVPEDLEERREDLRRKSEATEDPVAAEEYERAAGTLTEQIEFVASLRKGRERVLARLHHYVATMEKLRLALLNARSGDAEKLAWDLSPLLDGLEFKAEELDLDAKATMEVSASEK